MPKALISSSQHLVPVVKQMSISGDWDIVTIHPQVAQSLTNLDISARPLIDIATPYIRNQSLTYSARIVAELYSRDYEGNHLEPAVKNFINNEIPSLVYADLPDIAIFCLVLDEYKPDVILLHNDVEQINRAAAFWAKVNNIPCLHIPHAIYQNTENAHDIHRIITASHLASAGSFQSEWYVDCGMPPDHIFQTGLPQFDKFATMALDKRRSKAGLDIEQRQPVVCYTSSWRQDTNLAGMHDGVMETYEVVLQCAKRMPDIKFVIKTHPSGNNAPQHLEKAKEMGAKVAVTPHHLQQCLMAADLLLAYGPSNTILEGAHIPWLRLACTSGFEKDPEVHKINTDPPDVEMLMAAIGEILSQPPIDATRLRTKYLGPCDGQNYKRVAMLTGKLAGQNE